jgi:hypothetical protein
MNLWYRTFAAGTAPPDVPYTGSQYSSYSSYLVANPAPKSEANIPGYTFAGCLQDGPYVIIGFVEFAWDLVYLC